MGVIAMLGVALALPSCDAPDDGLDDELGVDVEGEEEEAEPRVYGGVQTNDPSRFAVVEVRTDFPDGTQGVCSGTLITEDVVVTAAHCFCDGIDASSCETSSSVFFPMEGGSGPVKSGTAVVHPNYYFAGNTVQHDIGLVLLNLPNGSADPVADITPIEIASSGPSVGETLEAVGFGYGDADCNSGSGFRRTADLEVFYTSSSQFRADAPSAGTCEGDSGGPAIDAQNRLKGVLSYKQSGSSGYMEADQYRDFLAQHACGHDELPVDMWNECTNALCPCGEGVGDCDNNAECQPGLFCAHDVGAEYGLPSTADVCEELPSPWLHVEFAGCNFGTPQFLVNWASTGNTPDSYHVDLKQGSGSYQSYYDGPNSGGGVYNGSSGRNDAFRVRVCRAGSCSSFTSKTTGSKDCNSNNPPLPL